MRTYEDIRIMVLRGDIQGLIKATKDADETIREEAVKVLRAMNPPEAKEAIEQALSDSSSKVRRAALGFTKDELTQGAKGKIVSGVHEHLADQAMPVIVEIPDEFKSKKDSLRWLWILIGTWGVSCILLAMLILMLMFSSGNFGNSGQIIGILVLGIPGIAMLWFAVKKLRSKKSVDSEVVKSKPQTVDPQMSKSFIKSEEINVGFPVKKRTSVLKDFDIGDILTFSIIFEGHLPMSKTVNPVDIAKEIMDDAHFEGKLRDVRLTPFAFVDMKRADEAKYYQDDSYTPQSDLEMLEKETLERFRSTYNTHEPLMRLINVKRMAFKSKSRVVSICWVLINVKS